LIVSEHVAKVFRRHKASIELLPAKFEKAFFLPVEPGSRWHEVAIGPMTDLYPGVQRKLLTRFVTDVPERLYYEVSMKRTGDLFEANQSQFTRRAISLGSDYIMNGEFDFKTSDEWTRKHKIYFSGVYVCEEFLFEELSCLLPTGLTCSGCVEG
jgi:hypothetical protein